MTKRHFKNQKSRVILNLFSFLFLFSSLIIVGCNNAGDSDAESAENEVMSNETFQKYYEPFPNVISPGASDINVVSEMTKALKAYELKNYEEADRIYQELPLTHINQFYHAITSWELGNYDLAKTRFNAVATKNNSPFQIPAKWYLGIISAKDGDLENARRLLQDVSKTGTYPDLQLKATEVLGLLAREQSPTPTTN